MLIDPFQTALQQLPAPTPSYHSLPACLNPSFQPVEPNCSLTIEKARKQQQQQQV